MITVKVVGVSVPESTDCTLTCHVPAMVGEGLVGPEHAALTAARGPTPRPSSRLAARRLSESLIGLVMPLSVFGSRMWLGSKNRKQRTALQRRPFLRSTSAP